MPDFALDYSVRFRTGFSVAGAREPRPELDRTLLRDADGMPVLPASSMRGRTRAELERLARGCGETICPGPYPEAMCPRHQHASQGQALYCLSCRIFGCPARPSSVVFHPLRCTDKVAPHAAIRTGVSIDRVTRRARDERFYRFEVAPSAATFAGRVTGRLAEAELAWLLAALTHVRHLGGLKAHGLGSVVVSVERVAVAGRPHRPEDILAWLGREAT